MTKDDRFKMLKGLVRYGHFKRSGQHHQFYIETEKFFRHASKESEIAGWLRGVSESIKKESLTDNPAMTVVFAPEHSSNTEFAHSVNNYIFNGMATVISVRTASTYRSNFEIEHMAIKKTIENFHKLYGASNIYLVFVDDAIQSGETFYRANELIRSILPLELRRNPIVFDWCFVLVDRLSKSSKEALLGKSENFHFFVTA